MRWAAAAPLLLGLGHVAGMNARTVEGRVGRQRGFASMEGQVHRRRSHPQDEGHRVEAGGAAGLDDRFEEGVDAAPPTGKVGRLRDAGGDETGQVTAPSARSAATLARTLAGVELACAGALG